MSADVGQGAESPEAYLAPGYYVDSDSDEVRAFAERALASLGPDPDPLAKAIALFEAVRDGLRYDPYSFSPDPEDYRASVIAGAEAGFCVPKAILLAAVMRAAGLPAALGFADDTYLHNAGVISNTGVLVLAGTTLNTGRIVGDGALVNRHELMNVGLLDGLIYNEGRIINAGVIDGSVLGPGELIELDERQYLPLVAPPVWP